MNAGDDTLFRRDRQSLPDLQSRVDTGDLRIHAVGIEDVSYPVAIRSHGQDLPTIAVLSIGRDYSKVMGQWHDRRIEPGGEMNHRA